MQFQANSGDFTPVPMGKYRATVTDGQEEDSPFKPGTLRARWRFDLGEVTCLDGEVKQVELTAFTSLSPTNSPKFGKSNLWKLAEACGLDPSQPFDENDIIGREILVVVIEEERRDGTGIFSKVDGYQAVPNGHQGAAQQPVPQGQGVAQTVQQGNQHGHDTGQGGAPNGANRRTPF